MNRPAFQNQARSVKFFLGFAYAGGGNAGFTTDKPTNPVRPLGLQVRTRCNVREAVTKTVF
jgi:hypothetical protein